jgi:hypothetical protein
VTNPPAPARLTILLARSADMGVILRRGPSKWVRMIRWDTKGDLFVPGQWLHATVSEFDLDLSADGDKLIYFAAAHRPWAEHPIWTAVSRPPYFTALAFWPYSHGWDPGGRFLEAHTIRRWYHEKDEPPPPRGSFAPPPSQLRIDAQPRGQEPWNDPTRDGWEWAGDVSHADWGGQATATWRKTGRVERGTIVRQQVPADRQRTPRGRHLYLYQHVPSSGEPSGVLEGAAWADWDRRGRLVFARDGRIFAADAERPAADPRELIDLNRMTPEPLPAPGAARRW